MRHETNIYTVLNLETGEKIEGTVSELCNKLKFPRRNMIAMYYQRGIIYQGKYKVVKRHLIYEEDSTFEISEYDKWEQSNIRRLDEYKVLALHEAYTSGRAKYWTFQHIAEECGVPVDTIKEIVKKHDTQK